MFRTNRPATAGAFHDRIHEIQQLRDMAAALIHGEPKWTAIIGPRKVGKSSLVLELARSCPHGVDFVVFDAEVERPLSWEIFRSYALRAADVLLGPDLPGSLEVAASTPDSYDELLSTPALRALPTDDFRILRALGTQNMDARFVRSCLDLPERLAKTLGRHVIIAFDEFQQLSTDWSLRQSDPIPVLRSAWQRHERVAYIVSGSGRTILEEMITRKHSPFFQHFSILHLDRFSEPDAVRLLVNASPPDRPIPQDLAERAVQVVSGHPYYVQLLGEQLTSWEPPYDDQALKAAIQDLLFARSGRLALYFKNVFDRAVGNSAFLASVLSALSTSPKRVTDVANDIGIRTGDAARYLERLGDVVVKEKDGRYRLEDPTFGLWLAWRKPGGSVMPMTLVGDAAEKEVAVALARMGFELVYQSRASRGAFDLLALRGSDQLGVQVKRSKLPLRFNKDTWNRMKADAKRFGWTWMIAAVAPDGTVSFHDPAKATRGREMRITEASTIDNVVRWLAR